MYFGDTLEALKKSLFFCFYISIEKSHFFVASLNCASQLTPFVPENNRSKMWYFVSHSELVEKQLYKNQSMVTAVISPQLWLSLAVVVAAVCSAAHGG